MVTSPCMDRVEPDHLATGQDEFAIVVSTAIGAKYADTFHNDSPRFKADYILANPPLNMEEWGGEQLKTVPVQYGIPPK